ncbi:hypothetical protein JHK82_028001 [Glycine max]|uniref:Uncharacterized protein n=1 Tax=Glycine soja TaxID=3848 RepID=A0A0B2PC83_GLYSO|nr:hypothetical protein JHK87_027910 [Glycine soja]KAG5127166.1 hypothetical protein JHK82_028001 [Glycine max]KHN05248.1 hypothetical protein glysoja_042971 [Glycine soja]
MNMKMSYSALLVLFLSLTFFTLLTLAGLGFSPLKPASRMAPPRCHDCSISRPAPYKPPPLYRYTSKGKP